MCAHHRLRTNFTQNFARKFLRRTVQNPHTESTESLGPKLWENHAENSLQTASADTVEYNGLLEFWAFCPASL